MKGRRGCLTNPLVLFVLVLLLVGFVGGPIGAGFLGLTKPTGLIGAPRPHIQLPSEGVVHIWENPLDILSFSITNTMLTALFSSLLLLFLAWRATRRLSLVPKGVQNLMEAFVEYFLGLVEGVAGKGRGKRFLPLVVTIFLFILLSNWSGLLPGFGTIGIVEAGHEEDFNQVSLGGAKLYYTSIGGEKAEAEGFVPFFRSANSDVNIPLSMAIVGMFMVQLWGARALGLGRYIQRFINVRQLLKGKVFFGGVDLAVGALEAISQGAQLISLTFRLFGNIFAGEVLMVLVAFLFPLVVVLPLFGLEIIIGLVQAFIFAMLILVFAALAVTEHEAPH